ncbi:inositol monophosphatase family protein [Streptomyces canus]|uniref:inositol monophosphatase family protein n=1 Tax=Streptomyces canus TaxID=58343 RepID=UPI0033B9B9DA
MIRQEHPDDAFLDEEFGAHGHGRRRWIIDAIDGTASFVANEPEGSTLIAVEEDGRVTLGMVSAPALGRRWWARLDSGSSGQGHAPPSGLYRCTGWSSPTADVFRTQPSASGRLRPD